MTTNGNVTTKVVIPCRFSYEHVFEPSAIDDVSEKKFSVSCIIPKTDKKTIDTVKAAIKAAYEIGVTSKFGGKKPSVWMNPLRDGDTDRADDEAYENAMFINASCKTRPGVVDKARQPITNQEEFYSGCYGYVSINFFPFSKPKMGIAAGLNNVMKVKDGEPLGGRVSAESDFAEIDINNAPFSDEAEADIFGD